MQRLSITTAWNETAAFVQRDFGALFTVALAFNALPNIVVQALLPAPDPANPGALAGLNFLATIVVLVLALVGTLAVSALALGIQNVVGGAIRHGFRRFPPLLAATFLLLLALVFLLTPLAAAAGIDAEALSSPSPDTLRRLTPVILVLGLILIPIGIRLMMMTPVAAAERPRVIGLFRRSWALTRGHFLKLLGFSLLVLLVLSVLLLAISFVAGILIALAVGRPEPGNTAHLLALLVGGVVNAAFLAVFTTMVARIYVQLSGGREGGGAASEPSVPTSGI